MKERLQRFIRRPENLFLVLLLSADFFYFILHLLSAYSTMPKAIIIGDIVISIQKDLLYLGKDRGFAEFFQYIKYLWIVIIVMIISIRKSQWRFLIWNLLFIYLLVDDFVMVPEKLGEKLASIFNLPSILVLEPKYIGQIVYAFFVGILVLLIISITMIRGNPQFRSFSKVMIGLVIALGVVGVGIDALNDFIKNNTLLIYFSILEDGSEMIIVSIMSWWAFSSVTS